MVPSLSVVVYNGCYSSDEKTFIIQTFVLKIPSRHIEGGLTVIQSIPCDLGGPYDICIAKVNQVRKYI